MGSKNMKTLRKLHGRIHEKMLAFRDSRRIKKLVRVSIKKSKRIDGDKRGLEQDYPVDFVVTWVDGSDPAWLAEKAKFSTSSIKDINDDASRYRDWDIFQYWFRAVEKFAPWVNQVYLVTWGHVPAWLNTDCPKLTVVRHEEIIPAEYLPTFNSHVIEWNMWRIPGLCEHFIYFNDDVFLNRPLKKTDFYENGFPKYCAIAKPIRLLNTMNAHRHARINSYGIFNANFDIQRCIESNPEKWFNYQYGDDVKYNIRAYEDGFFSGMYFSHLAVPFRKSSMRSFCEAFPESVKRTCQHRLRSSDDIMHQAVQLWEMFHGSFEPVGKNYYGTLFLLSIRIIGVVEKEMLENKKRMICVNDHELINKEDFEIIRRRLEAAFQNKFPQKSCFEK